MDIAKLAWGERSKRRLRGTRELAGHAMTVSLARQGADSEAAEIVLRAAGGPLPPSLLGVTVVMLGGRSCPVQAVRVDGAAVLQGQVPASVADA